MLKPSRVTRRIGHISHHTPRTKNTSGKPPNIAIAKMTLKSRQSKARVSVMEQPRTYTVTIPLVRNTPITGRFMTYPYRRYIVVTVVGGGKHFRLFKPKVRPKKPPAFA